jgi:hypothetical protein
VRRVQQLQRAQVPLAQWMLQQAAACRRSAKRVLQLGQVVVESWQQAVPVELQLALVAVELVVQQLVLELAAARRALGFALVQDARRALLAEFVPERERSEFGLLESGPAELWSS